MTLLDTGFCDCGIEFVPLIYFFFCSLALQQLEKAQLEEIDERKRIAKEIADEMRLSSSFVELLNEHQLFESLFKDDEDGRKLLLIGEEADQLLNEYS